MACRASAGGAACTGPFGATQEHRRRETRRGLDREGVPHPGGIRGFAGGHIAIPTPELCSVWGMLQAARLKPYDVRTWLAAREVSERRRFGPHGSKPSFELSELLALVGGGDTSALRASLRRLAALNIVRWGPTGPRFLRSPEDLAAPDLSPVLALLQLMPRGRRTFPMPRRVLRLLAGGVKRSVLATVLGHLVRCPHFTPSTGWNGAGTCKASWVAEAFGLSQSAVQEARSFLIESLGWLTPVTTPQWHKNRFGGKFEVNLAWGPETGPSEASAAPEGPPSPPPGSGYPRAGIEPESGYPDSKQTSPKEIQASELPPRGGAEPPDDVRRTGRGGESGTKPQQELPPTLSKVTAPDLRSVPRVMALFDEALSSPVWARKGWTPRDTYLERLNWAAAARRASVRGGPNPPGLFVHLVSQRLWQHVSNDDEEAVRPALVRWMNPGAMDRSGSGGGGGGPLTLLGSPGSGRRLSKDAAVIKRIESTLLSRGAFMERAAVDRELLRQGWSAERVASARAELLGERQREREAGLEDGLTPMSETW